MSLCPVYGFEINDSLRISYCRNCRDKCLETRSMYPRRELEKVDIFKLARLMAEKRAKGNQGQ